MKCPECGKKNKDDAILCSKCGYRLVRYAPYLNLIYKQNPFISFVLIMVLLAVVVSLLLYVYISGI